MEAKCLLAKPNVVVEWLILIIKHEEKRSIGGVGVDGRIVEDKIMDGPSGKRTWRNGFFWPRTRKNVGALANMVTNL
jgi:hypothetical protein